MSDYPPEFYTFMQLIEEKPNRPLHEIPDDVYEIGWPYAKLAGFHDGTGTMKTAPGLNAFGIVFMRNWREGKSPVADEPEKLSESDDFMPFGELWPMTDHFDTYRKAKLFLDKHPEIRRRYPSKQRLEVHVKDWLEHLPPKYTDEQLEAICEKLEGRKEDEKR
jgi:hypothetical protein